MSRRSYFFLSFFNSFVLETVNSFLAESPLC
nr:MAG TPA: hypothetical protein [Caudoviricetes sp.]